MKKYIAGFFSCVIVVAISIPFFWPQELNLLFSTIFWSATLLVVASTGMVGVLYWTDGGSSRGTRFSFGLLLILASAFMYGMFEEISQNAIHWEPAFRKDYPRLIGLLGMSLIYVKSVVAFGFAALGANVAANAIGENLKTH